MKTSERLQQYTQDTTLHGISHVTNNDTGKLRRFIWVVLFLGSFTGFLFALAQGLQLYFSYPVSTKIDYVTSRHLEFPSITICNFNYIRKSFVQSHYPESSTVVKMMEMLNPLGITDQQQVNFSDPEVIEELSSVDMEDVDISGGHQMEEMFLRCSFMSTNTSTWPCKFHQDLFVRTRTEMGMCFTFHPASYIERYGPLLTSRAGSAGGLYMWINVEQYEYKIHASMSAGIKVLVHDPKDSPRMTEMGVAIQPGTDTNLALTKVEKSNLPPPYAGSTGSTCKETNLGKDPNFRNPLKYFREYSFSACLQECHIDFVLEKCHCAGYVFTVPGVRVCNMYEFMTCYMEQREAYNEQSSDGKNCGCLHACEETVYHVTQSDAYFPNDNMISYLHKQFNQDVEFFRHNVLGLNVYFDELGYTKIEKVASYTAGNLFAEIGGFLGLCLGASLLTIAEFLEAIIISISQLRKGQVHGTKPPE